MGLETILDARFSIAKWVEISCIPMVGMSLFKPSMSFLRVLRKKRWMMAINQLKYWGYHVLLY